MGMQKGGLRAQVLRKGLKYIEITTKNGKSFRIPIDALEYQFEEGDCVSIIKKQGKITVLPIKKKRKLSIPIICTLVISCICSIVVFIVVQKHPESNDSKDKTTRSAESKLDSCLERVSILYSYATEEYYSNQIGCYNKYRVKGYKERIEEIKTNSKKSILNVCLQNVTTEYSISEEEVNVSSNSTTPQIGLLQRLVNGYKEQINCYINAGADSYTDEISALQQKVAEGEALMSRISNGSPSYNYSAPTYNYPVNSNYNAPTPEEVAPSTPALTCDDYHAQYYSIYNKERKETNEYYNSAITNAHNNICGARQGGCPQASNLEREKDRELARIKNQYKTSMESAGCDPAQYVDF